ncbi:MAG: hypothetical protein ABIJ61_06450 [bacterium]
MTEIELQNLSSIAVEAPQVEERSKPRLPQIKAALLFTFEFDENKVYWSAVPRQRRKRSGWQRGTLDAGYNKLERLQDWFHTLWSIAGKYQHEFHIHVTGSEILRRSFKVPVVPKGELSAVVHSQARQNFPFNIDRGFFGWKVIDQLEWAGGPKYEVYSQALAEHWHSWLGELFGEHLDQVSFIGAGGQQQEQLLLEISPSFRSEDSYLIRLRGDLLETGFYHNGHLEFFREVPVESLADSDVATELQAALGELAPTVEMEHSLQINDIRIIISDALEYYYGLFGQRRIGTVYLSLPSAFEKAAMEFAAGTADCKVVNLCEHLRDNHYLPREIDQNATGGPLEWLSVLPKHKLAASLVNLLPAWIVQRRRAARLFGRSLLGLVLLLIVMGSLSGLKVLGSDVLRDELATRQAEIVRTRQHPILAQLGDFRAQINSLTANLQGYSKLESVDYLQALKLLSTQSREAIRLNSLSLKRQPAGLGMIASISGIVRSANERQEGELFAYVADLSRRPEVVTARVLGKQVDRQLGQQTLKFDLEVVLDR